MKTSRQYIALSLLLLGIVLGLGWLTQRFSASYDITANDRHSLSPATQNILLAMQGPVELIAVIGPNPEQRDGIQSLIEKFQTIKPDMQLQFINPETDPAAARALDAAPGGELILRTDSREQRLQNLSERSLANSLRQLNREGDRDIVFITGHDERSPIRISNDGWSTAADRLSNIGLVSRELSLVSEPYLDESIELVVIAAPRRPYFPGEIASLSNYIDSGGNLLWLSEVSSQPQSNDTQTTTGPSLELLSNNLGVDTLPGTVIDTASQTLNAETPDFVLLDRFPAHPVTRLLTNPVLLPQASALAVTPLAGQTTQALLQTNESSWTESGALTGTLSFDQNTVEVPGPLLLGVAIERQLSEGMQRFAVIGDADFAASQFIDNGANQAFLEALILWLTGDSASLDFVTQKAPDSELQLSTSDIVGLSTLYLAGIPVLFLTLAGIVRWRRRKD